jgi:hypothetical protein
MKDESRSNPIEKTKGTGWLAVKVWRRCRSHCGGAFLTSWIVIDVYGAVPGNLSLTLRDISEKTEVSAEKI